MCIRDRANTALTVTSTIPNVHSVMVLDSNGDEIGVCIRRISNNAYEITSNASLADVVVQLTGATA